MPNAKIPVPNILYACLLHSIIQAPELAGPSSFNNYLIILQELLRKFPHEKSTAGRLRREEVQVEILPPAYTSLGFYEDLNM